MYSSDDHDRELLKCYYKGRERETIISDESILPKGTYYIKIKEGLNRSSALYRFTVNYTAIVKPAKPTGLTVTNTSSGVKIKYKKVTGARKYLIYRDNKRIATVSGTSYTDKTKLKNGSKHKYKIKAANDSYTGNASETVMIYRMDGSKIKALKQRFKTDDSQLGK